MYNVVSHGVEGMEAWARPVLCLVCGICVVLAGVSLGEATDGGSSSVTASPRGDASATTASEEVSKDTPPVSGDVIYFKNGKKLSGVQVWRTTPTVVEVQVAPGLDLLQLNRRQIERIEYDAIDPRRSPSTEAASSKNKSPFLIGEEVTPALHRSLTATVPENLLKIEGRDFLDVLKAACEATGASLEVAEGVSSLAAEERRWTASLPPTITLEELLAQFAKDFPAIQVQAAYDKIQVFLRRPASDEEKNTPKKE